VLLVCEEDAREGRQRRRLAAVASDGRSREIHLEQGVELPVLVIDHRRLRE
jgi:hypothetical protein